MRKIAALFAILLFVPAAFAYDRPAPSQKAVEAYSVIGYVEDIMRGSVKVNGTYHYIEGSRIRDAAGLPVGMSAITKGSKVEIKYKKENDSFAMVETILIHGPFGEGER